MKNYFNSIVLCGLLFSSLLNVFSQEKSLNEQEFTALRNTASEKLKSRNYRVVMSSESYKSVNDSSPYYFTSEITEYILPDRRHYILERKTELNTTREETISIGQRKYSRQNNEVWKELLPVGNNNGGGSGSGSGFSGSPLNYEKTIEYKYKGKETVKNQKADLYEVLTTTKYNSPNFRATTIMTERFWFDKDGMFLKTEIESKINNKVNSHTVREYEYDPKIKIEAPVKDAAGKSNN